MGLVMLCACHLNFPPSQNFPKIMGLSGQARRFVNRVKLCCAPTSAGSTGLPESETVCLKYNNI
jgi:hypothetical protein